MSNMRIVWDNAADRGSIAATSEAGQLVAANLRNNLKSKVWRALSTEASIILAWDTPEPIGAVVLAFNNLTSKATVRIKGYTWSDSMIPEYNSGAVECAPAPALGQFQWGTPLGENFYKRGGASLFAYGYGGYGVVWVPGGRAFRRMEIRISDPDNPDTYIEVGRLIAGPWWSPMYNFDFNHSVTMYDSTENKRTGGGDLRGEKMAKWRIIDFSLSNMNSEDRAAMMRMVRLHGVSEPFFISLFPESEDKLLEQSYQLWGKLTEPGKLSQPRYDVYSSRLTVEEM